jgi:hypothetical protein
VVVVGEDVGEDVVVAVWVVIGEDVVGADVTGADVVVALVVTGEDVVGAATTVVGDVVVNGFAVVVAGKVPA